jgi:hypothetical protein
VLGHRRLLSLRSRIQNARSLVKTAAIESIGHTGLDRDAERVDIQRTG